MRSAYVKSSPGTFQCSLGMNFRSRGKAIVQGKSVCASVCVTTIVYQVVSVKQFSGIYDDNLEDLVLFT